MNSLKDILAKSIRINQAPGKENVYMDKYLTKYVDNEIVREHAFKSLHGYNLQVCDLSEHDKFNLLACMFEHDKITKELLLDRMQDIINERCDVVELQDKYEKGFKAATRSNGEIVWVKRSA